MNYATNDYSQFDLENSTVTESKAEIPPLTFPSSTVMQNITNSKTTESSTILPRRLNTVSPTMIQTINALTNNHTTKVTTALCPAFTLQDLGVISAENIKNKSFTLHWSDNTIGLCGIYKVEKLSEDGILLCTFNFNNNTCNLFELSPGQTYTVNVHFVNTTNAILTRSLNVTTGKIVKKRNWIRSYGGTTKQNAVSSARDKKFWQDAILQEKNRFLPRSKLRPDLSPAPSKYPTMSSGGSMRPTVDGENQSIRAEPEENPKSSVLRHDLDLPENLTLTELIEGNSTSLQIRTKLTSKHDIDSDSDECSSGDNRCEQICIERFKFEDRRGYECNCERGFVLNSNRENCTDIDECSNQPCWNGATCIESINSFACTCLPGFTGKLCEQDVDECALGKHGCDQNNGICNNTLGFYTCSCKEGYEGDGFICKAKRLFNYGYDVGDTQLFVEGRDFNSPIIRIPQGFPFDDAFYYRLYFSDNGLITFQRQNDYLQYMYSSPFWAFSEYFSLWTPPMIAVFWDDADLTRGIGSIYYQVYDFQIRTDTHGETFEKNLKEKVNEYYGSELNISSFKPKWALKITWENVLPYSGYQNTDPEGTNTYQAVLTTDGIFSFCLIQFKDGGMNWKYDAKSDYSNYALMGYYSASLRSYLDSNMVFNDPHTRFDVPPEKIYHPDRYPGFKTGKNGLWAYRLERNNHSTINPRQKCMDWYLREPESYWSNDTSPCPCSFWQAIFDNAFTWGNSIYYYGYGVKEPQEKEVEPYHDCCRDSGDDYYCDLYRTKRPLDFCFGYIPPQIGFVFGDPHVVTLDNVKYTFNGLGEFILLNIMDDDDVLTFSLQGRTLRAGENRTSQATSFVALAAQGPSGTKVQWTLNDDDDEISVMVNGRTVEVTENSTYTNQVTLQKTSNNETVATFTSGTSITVSETKRTLAFTTSLANSLKNKTEGLLGVWNDDKTDDFKAANGTFLDFDGTNLPNETQIFFDFGLTWKTSVDNSVFTYNTTAGESWYTYNNNSFVPKFYDQLLQTTAKEKIDKANETCQGNDDCIFDALSTDDLSFGAATLQSLTTFVAQNSTMNNYPPNITGDSTIQTRLHEPVFVLFTATDKNNDEVKFSVLTDSPDITMTENGNFSWNPTSSTPVFAIVQANDSKAVSVLGLTLTLCNCSINSTCDYSRSTLSTKRNNTVFKVTGCICSLAYTGDYCTEDFDACQDNQCFLNNTCKDKPAPLEGYTCDPCPGYLKGDGIKCFDLDECLENVSSCEQICLNVFGGYNCSCNEGYTVSTLNSSLCTDFDECSNTSICLENAECQNAIGNYSCMCKTGYEGQPDRFCIDIDECLDYTACPNRNSICINTEGSYICMCRQGYEGSNCSDVDECLNPKSNNCSQTRGICTNLEGSYACQCIPGYSGDGITCSDINECKSCSPDSQCASDGESYNCTCKPGFSGNGTTCIPLPGPCDSAQCSPSFCKNGGTCVTNPADDCKPFCQCPRQYRGESCTLGRQQFTAEPLPTTPKRSVNITLRIKDINVTVLSNRSSTDFISLTNITTAKVLEIMSGLQRFAGNLKPVFGSQGETITVAVVSLFDYNGNKAVIDFLNDGLYVAIQNAFNNLQRFRRDLRSVAISFAYLNRTDIKDMNKLSYNDLLNFLSCNDTAFVGYMLQWDDESGAICQSPCYMGHCLNEAECQHLTTGPVCKCVPRAIYSSYGQRCEHLSLKLGAFFGILFGALGFLLIVSSIVIWKCKRSKRERLINDGSSVGSMENYARYYSQPNIW
ncbi:mucin-4-like [Scyliorhinus canicula]|uniref:mucin-4-like n=1 Tax=Scyliorhinus canicula TaxID=7830 RepID=UPI0018F713DD|nr:mucin-4-like [Scyliorhinus canicula]